MGKMPPSLAHRAWISRDFLGRSQPGKKVSRTFFGPRSAGSGSANGVPAGTSYPAIARDRRPVRAPSTGPYGGARPAGRRRSILTRRHVTASGIPAQGADSAFWKMRTAKTPTAACGATHRLPRAPPRGGQEWPAQPGLRHSCPPREAGSHANFDCSGTTRRQDGRRPPSGGRRRANVLDCSSSGGTAARIRIRSPSG